MQAAITAHDRGHQVYLCERSSSLGGTISFAEHVSFKADLKKFMDVLIRRVESRDITVLLDTEATEELASHIVPDVIISAIGADPVVPPIPGIDGDNVVLALGMHDEKVSIGKDVVVVGGGLVGCEEGLELAMKGHKVTVLEMREAVAIDSAYLHREALLLEIAKNEDSISLKTGMKCTSITDKGVFALNSEGDELFFPADTVIVAAGMRSREGLHSLRDWAQDFLVIGDAKKPRRVLEAVRAGYDAGMHI